MDPLKLLSRSTRLNKAGHGQAVQRRPSSASAAQPHTLPHDQISNDTKGRGKKRKRRSHDAEVGLAVQDDTINFFSPPAASASTLRLEKSGSTTTRFSAAGAEVAGEVVVSPVLVELDIGDRKRIMKQHKLKATWLNAPAALSDSKSKNGREAEKMANNKVLLFPRPLQAFGDLGARHGVGRFLTSRIDEQGYKLPTEVQTAALPLLLDEFTQAVPSEQQDRARDINRAAGVDLLTVAPTGSGKTLAFMIPLIHGIQKNKRLEADQNKYISAIILAPTKELVAQIVNEGRKLGGNLKITQVKRGMRLSRNPDEPGDEQTRPTVVKSDVLVSTPGLMQSLVENDSAARMALSTVRTLVLDEADVLLDPLFRDQTLSAWNALINPKLRVSLWSATMGSNIEELAESTIDIRRNQLADETRTVVPQAPMVRLVVGLKDSAVPNVEHKLIYAATEQGKLMGLRQLLHPTTNFDSAGPPLRPPFLIFTQTIERAIALHSELLYDIPAEAGGIGRIAVLHSDLSDTVRDSVMTRFRRGEIWVLITTDLLSRGVDFRGVNGIVNYDMPTSSAAYVHRVGRTGRAGREGGVAVTFYSTEDIPYLKHVANVVAIAQKRQDGEGGMQQWLLDALPKLSKNEKRNLKRHGIESRTARGRDKDPKAAKKARISTKAGYVRREENRKRGAVQSSQRRIEAQGESDGGEDTDFGGFD